MPSRTSRASATSSLSVTTQSRLSSRPRVAATYRPRRVVAGVARAMAVVDGVGLVAVLGGGVAEADVLADVVGGEGDGAVSPFTGHGQRTVGCRWR